MVDAIKSFMQGIFGIAGLNPLAAVAILFFVTIVVIVVCIYMVARLWIEFRMREVKQKKKEEGFIHTAGLLNIFEAKVIAEFAALKTALTARPECYFVGDSGEAKRAALFEAKSQIDGLREDVKEVKQIVYFRPKNGS